MEKKTVSLSTVLLVMAIILIGVMGGLLYIQKTETDRQIAELENAILENSIKEKEQNVKDAETEIKYNENELPNSEEVNLLVTNFMNLFCQPLAAVNLKKLGYNNSWEIYDNALQSYNDGKFIGGPDIGSASGKTQIKYSDFEDKICNYMTPDVVRQRFSRQFLELNGFLYMNLLDAAGGVDISNVSAEFIYKNNDEYFYFVRYTYQEVGEPQEYECIISIGNYNNKNVVTGFMD